MERKTTRGLLALLFAFVVAFTVSCATPAGRTTGTVVDDATITARVKTALLADKDVSGVAVSVDTFKGEVVLNGAVSTQAQLEKAESLARGVSGVRSVKNLIQIK
jgi:hyperosmotically inducible protein